MNMSVTQFVQAPAIVGRSRSVRHEIIDTVIEGPPRTAADEIAEYLARHMNMSVTQFVQAPAIVGRSRSVRHEIIDTVIEGPPRTAADEIAEYLARH